MHLGAGTNATTNTMHSIAHDAIITLSHTHTQTDAHMLMELYDYVYALAVRSLAAVVALNTIIIVVVICRWRVRGAVQDGMRVGLKCSRVFALWCIKVHQCGNAEYGALGRLCWVFERHRRHCWRRFNARLCIDIMSIVKRIQIIHLNLLLSVARVAEQKPKEIHQFVILSLYDLLFLEQRDLRFVQIHKYLI